jgi:hypothetical protein
MPIPAAAVAAYAAVAGALPSATPVLAGMAVSVGLIMSHEPGRLDAVQLTNKPEVAAECVKRNVVSLKSRLVAIVQPLHGTETMGVLVRRGIVGDPLFNVVIQESASGSHAEVRPLAAADQQPDLMARFIAGC